MSDIGLERNDTKERQKKSMFRIRIQASQSCPQKETKKVMFALTFQSSPGAYLL